MTDELDRAAEYERLEREAAISRHVARSAGPVPVCEYCEEHPVHVAPNGLRWRLCVRCAGELGGGA